MRGPRHFAGCLVLFACYFALGLGVVGLLAYGGAR
jgi:hypothetical protein